MIPILVEQLGNGLCFAPGGESLAIPLNQDLLPGAERDIVARTPRGDVDHAAAQIRSLLGTIQNNGGVLYTGKNIQSIGPGGSA